MQGPENKFRDNVLRPKLEAIEYLYYFVKEAKALRAIPDIVGHIKGRYFMLEVKKDGSNSSLNHPRAKLQAYRMQQCRNRGGFAEFVYPENCDEIIKKLIAWGEYRNYPAKP